MRVQAEQKEQIARVGQQIAGVWVLKFTDNKIAMITVEARARGDAAGLQIRSAARALMCGAAGSPAAGGEEGGGGVGDGR
jgi:hypothetical protein